VDVELAEREIEVHRFRESWRDGERRGFEIECSAGTYVRSLIADLGDAYCEQLRRTRIGSFDVADADPERPVGLMSALQFIPEVALDPERARQAGHGVLVVYPGAPPEGVVRLSDADGLIALAQAGPGARLKPIVGFR
jgi:tRNA pseudouridine55 synthase